MIINIGTCLEPRYGGIYTFVNTAYYQYETLNISLSSRIKPTKSGNILYTNIFHAAILIAKKFRHIDRFDIHGLYSPYILLILLNLWILCPKISVYVYPHGMLYRSVIYQSKTLLKKSWLILFRLIVSNLAFKFCALSYQEEHEIRQCLQSFESFVLPPKYFPKPNSCLLANLIRKKSNQATKKFLLLGRYSPEKQFLEAIITFIKLQNQNAELHVFGDQLFDCDYFKACTDIVHKHQSTNIFLHDFVNRNQLKKIFLEFHACIVYSTKENLSFALIESAVNGCIVITNESVGASSFLTASFSYISDSPSNLKYLKDAMIEVVDMSPSEYYNKALKSLEYSIETFCR